MTITNPTPETASKKQKSTDSSPKRKYEVRVPIISFEEAIKLTKEICKEGGFEDLLNAALKVTGSPKSSSSFVYKIIGELYT